MKKPLFKVLGAVSLVVALVVSSLISACCTPEPDALVISSIVVTTNSDTSVTITWATNRDATSKVDYGLTTTYDMEKSSTTLTMAHSITLDELTAGETYNYIVTSVDAEDLSDVSNNQTFNTTELVISNVAYTATNRSLTITWATDDAATSQVEYGADATYGMATTATTTNVTSHSVTISDLPPETTYHYKVLSTTTAGSAESGDNTAETGDPAILKIGRTTQASADNPFAATIGAGDATHFSLLYEPLVWVLFDIDKGIQPAIAESWSFAANTTDDDIAGVWTVNLDPDAKWPNGTAITATDVEFSLETLIGLANGATDDLANILVQSDSGDTDDAAVLSLVHSDTESDKLVRASGSFISDGYVAGEMVYISGTIDGPDKGSTGDQDGAYKVASVSALELVFSDAVTVTSEGPSAGMDVTSTGPTADAITVVDADTITFTIHTYAATFMRYLGDAKIAPAAEWNTMTDKQIFEADNADPIGSGPYTLKSREKDTATIYEARLDYWGGVPPIDEIQMRYYTNEEAQLLAIKTGEIQTVGNFNLPTAIPQLVSDPDIEVFQIADNTTMTLYPNMRIEPWDDPDFRNAVSIGIDRQALIDFGANSWGNIPVMFERDANFADVQSIYEDIKWGYEGLTHAARIDLANAALDAITGISDYVEGETRTYNGTPLEFDLLAATWTEHTTIAELLAEDLLEMGIDAKVVPTNVTTLVSKVYRQKSDATMGDWELHVWGRPWAPEFDYAGDQWQQYDSTSPLRLSKRGYIMGWTGTEADLFDTTVSSLKAKEEGNAVRDAEILDAMKIWAAELPAIPLYNSINPGVYRTDMYSGWTEDNGMISFGAVTAMTAIYNFMGLEPV